MTLNPEQAFPQPTTLAPEPTFCPRCGVRVDNSTPGKWVVGSMCRCPAPEAAGEDDAREWLEKTYLNWKTLALLKVDQVPEILAAYDRYRHAALLAQVRQYRDALRGVLAGVNELGPMQPSEVLDYWKQEAARLLSGSDPVDGEREKAITEGSLGALDDFTDPDVSGLRDALDNLRKLTGE